VCCQSSKPRPHGHAGSITAPLNYRHRPGDIKFKDLNERRTHHGRDQKLTACALWGITSKFSFFWFRFECFPAIQRGGTNLTPPGELRSHGEHIWMNSCRAQPLDSTNTNTDILVPSTATRWQRSYVGLLKTVLARLKSLTLGYTLPTTLATHTCGRCAFSLGQGDFHSIQTSTGEHLQRCRYNNQDMRPLCRLLPRFHRRAPSRAASRLANLVHHHAHT
jgi:hypothetical protein